MVVLLAASPDFKYCHPSLAQCIYGKDFELQFPLICWIVFSAVTILCNIYPFDHTLEAYLNLILSWGLFALSQWSIWICLESHNYLTLLIKIVLISWMCCTDSATKLIGLLWNQICLLGSRIYTSLLPDICYCKICSNQERKKEISPMLLCCSCHKQTYSKLHFFPTLKRKEGVYWWCVCLRGPQLWDVISRDLISILNSQMTWLCLAFS